MSIIKKIAFNFFEKIEEKKLDKENSKSKTLSEPNQSTEEKEKDKKSVIKKSIIWVTILSIIAIIIGVSVWSSNRKTFIELPKDGVTLKIDGKEIDKEVPYKVTGPQPITISSGNLNIDLTPENLLKAYYVSSGYGMIGADIFIKNGNALPYKIKINYEVPSIVNNISNYSFRFNGYILTASIPGVDNTTPTPSPTPNQPVTKVPTGTTPPNGQGNNNSGTPEKPTTPPADQQKPVITNSLANFLGYLANEIDFEPSGFNWYALVSSLLPIITLVITITLIFYLTRKSMGTGANSIFGIGKSTAEPTKTKVKFSDVAGISEVKKELIEVVDFIKNPQKYESMGARSPKGVILYGPPGTGKTLIAKAVAGEADCNFYPVSGSSFDDMLVGVGAKRVKDLFAKARKNAPSIIFIDEIDSVAAKRGKNDIVGGGGGAADQTINQLLAEMDGFSPSAGVIVIAATNHLDVIDDAILRPGRFDRHIQVVLPDISERTAILKIHARNKNVSKKVDMLEIARRTPGFSGAQLENVLNEAALLAVREDRKAISINDLDEAIDRTIGGPQREVRVMTDFEKEQIAYHEAGHAIVGLTTENSDVVEKITIVPRGNAAGYTLNTPRKQEKQVQTKLELLENVRMLLGGRAAEEIIFGKDMITAGASNDLYKVSNIVRAMVLQFGMDDDAGLTQFFPSEGPTPHQKLFSEQTGKELDVAIDKIIKAEYAKAKTAVKNNRKEMDLIVETLILLETIVKSQIDYIHENMKLPEEALIQKEKFEKIKKNKKDDKESEKDSKEKPSTK